MEAEINISRPAYSDTSFNEAYGRIQKEPQTHREKLQNRGEKVKKSFSCSGQDVANMILAKVPFINTLRKYNIRTQFLSDAVAGLCVGIIHIAQGLGFAIMAGVPPIYGLYASFWPAILYVIFGTGHHVSMGSMALISLMIRTVVDREVATLNLPAGNSQGTKTINSSAATINATEPSIMISSDGTLNNSTVLEEMLSNGTIPFDLDAFKVSVAMSLSLLIGLIQFVMGVLHLGIVTTFMPAPFIGGLTTGAAFHILTSQLKFVLGISLPPHEGPFKLPLTWYDVALRIPQIKIAELIIAVLCMTIILVIKIQINNRFKDKMIVPIPPELVVVVLSCLVSYFANLEGNFGVTIVKKVPNGMLPPMMPPVNKWIPDYFPDAFMISLMSFSIAFSMGTLFGGKHNYTVDSNQELIAIGICHGIGALFGSFAGTAAPPRCFILDVTGATTQVSGIITSVFLLFVIFLMGSLFEPLPTSVLGGIIIVAILPLFMQFLNLKNLWKVNKYDFSIWLVSWFSVTFLDLNTGLIIGIVYSVATIIFQLYTSKGISMTTLTDSEIVVPSATYLKSKDMKAVEIFQFQGNLNFVSKEQFKSQLLKHMQDIPTKEDSKEEQVYEVDKAEESHEMSDPNAEIGDKTIQKDDGDNLLSTKSSRFLVLDFSHVSYIDIMGLTTLKKVQTDLGKADIQVVLACVTYKVMRTLEKSGGKWNNGEPIMSYPSLVDAITVCNQFTKV